MAGGEDGGRRLRRGDVRLENRDDGRREVHHPTSDKPNLVILELTERAKTVSALRS